MNKSKLLSFIGYGRLDAPVWFIGMEERLSGSTGLSKQLAARSRFDAVMDCREAHEKLQIVCHHQKKPKLQPTWNKMCDLMLSSSSAYEANSPEEQREVRRCYQKTILAEATGIPCWLSYSPRHHPDLSSSAV